MDNLLGEVRSQMVHGNHQEEEFPDDILVVAQEAREEDRACIPVLCILGVVQPYNLVELEAGVQGVHEDGRVVWDTRLFDNLVDEHGDLEAAGAEVHDDNRRGVGTPKSDNSPEVVDRGNRAGCD